MIDAMKGCVGTFDECVIPILTPEQANACNLNSDDNAEYAEWAQTCSPRGDPITFMVVGPSAVSLGMTVVFGAMFFIRSAKRIRVRTAPLAQLKWNGLSELQLKAILRMLNQPDTGTKKEMIERVSELAVRSAGQLVADPPATSRYTVRADTTEEEANKMDANTQDLQLTDTAGHNITEEAVVDEEGASTADLQLTDTADRGQLEDKSKLAILHEELEKMKLQDTAFETFVFIFAIVVFAYTIQPMLMQKEDVGCGTPLPQIQAHFTFLLRWGWTIL